MPRPILSRQNHDTNKSDNWTGQRLDADLWRDIDAAIEQREPEMIRLRRTMHAAPEPAHEERETTALVAAMLRDMDLTPRVLSCATGIVADIDLGGSENEFIAIRCELDCVQVPDEKTTSYASERAGLCHACGHDAHMTMVIGCASAIAERRERLAALPFRRNVRLLFQPAEETSTGARSMIKQGMLDGVSDIIAVHVDPFLDAGCISLRKGPITSACRAFQITISGRSGHSARPFEAIDPIPAAVNVVSQLYQLAPRSMDSRYPLALTVASIRAGNSFNAIPDSAVITGTLRTARSEDARNVSERMDAVVRGVETATGCTAELQFLHDAPPTANDGRIIEVMAAAARDTVGEDNVRWVDVPSLGAEDFAFYQEMIRGAIVRIGSARRDGSERHPLHSSHFDIDESALAIGARFLTRSALELASG